MKSGIFATFALDGGEARKTLTHLRELGYDCADLQTFVNTETDFVNRLNCDFTRFIGFCNIAHLNKCHINNTSP